MNDFSNDNCFEELQNLIKNTDCTTVQIQPTLTVLKTLTNLMRESDKRNCLYGKHWEVIAYIAEKLFSILSKEKQTDEELDILIELFRFLRNSCAGSVENTHAITENSSIFHCAKEPLLRFMQKENTKEILLLKVCVQLFGNILVSCSDSKAIIWKLFLEGNKFRNLLRHSDQSVQECALMVLYNCMSDETCHYIFQSQVGQDLLVTVTDCLLQNQVDWGILFIEYILRHKEFLSNCFEALPLNNRLLIIDIIFEALKNSPEDMSFTITLDTVEGFKNLFLKNVNRIYNMQSSVMEPTEIVSILSVLCSASVSNAYISMLQNSQDLLCAVVECLKSVHFLGKESVNDFSNLGETKHLTSQFSQEIANHPFYGFKKNLVRLIGNLCYSRQDNQDLVRSLDGIPLILDCCKLDAKNPYIIQWCILAIRNLLDKNAENQAIVAAITVSGDMVNTEFLGEMGFELKKVNGEYRISTAAQQKPHLN